MSTLEIVRHGLVVPELVLPKSFAPNRRARRHAWKCSRDARDRGFVGRAVSTAAPYGINHGVSSFAYSGASQAFVVPPGVSQVTIECWGAQGGTAPANTTRCLGGYVKGTFTVTPGETLTVYVGGKGLPAAADGIQKVGGFNGGGSGNSVAVSGARFMGSGGGASDVRRGGIALGNRMLVAGGGGGASWFIDWGGHGGADTGEAGGKFSSGAQTNTLAGGGTQLAGGAAGTSSVGGTSNGAAGALGLGGGGAASAGGGGGGGYYGGGQGSAGTDGVSDGSGGGGSNFVGIGVNTITTQGVRQSDGLVTITW